MEKLTRFFATEADSGKDTSRLITGRLDCPPPKKSSNGNHPREGLETLGRTSLPESAIFVDADTHTKSNGVTEVARIAVKAKGRILFVDPIGVLVVKAQGNYVALVNKSGSYLVRA